jgi:drug/metabolite transporter (DMT)-like permease
MARDRREMIWLAAGLILAVVFDTVQQIAWKIGIVALPETADWWIQLVAATRQPLLWLVVALMIIRLFNWLMVLKLADLSYAQPITSLSYVTVAAASAFYLKETLTPLQITGIALIMAGVWCTSRTAPKGGSLADAPVP